jgi:hypothetical protein
MKKITFLVLVSLSLINSHYISAQCTLYDPSSIYIDFEDTLPCSSTCGTPSVSAFEIWSNEAYLLGELAASSQYDITLGSPSGGGWNPTMTVASWNGTNVGAVVGFVNGRSLTVTIPTTGDYIIIISQTGVCNGAITNSIDNGVLSFNCGTNGAVCPSLGIEDVVLKDDNLLLYPNPTSDYLNIKLEKTIIQSLSIVDINGRVLKKQDVNEYDSQINVTDLNAGIYLVKVETELGISTQKFIKK